ncbi:MAG: MarR family transcriptional regulator [Nitrososphaerota archaeon]|nr:MarR family transcriptional regulator [Nitrososphaerota archaeon]
MRKVLMEADDRLIFLLFRTQNKLKNHLRNQLGAAGVRITVVQAGILFLLKQRDGRTMTELSQVLSTDNSAVTGLVDRLEKLHLIVRKTAPNDRRAYLIHITPEGLEEIERAKGIIRSVNEEIKEGFSTEEINAFKKVLNNLFERFKKE